MALTLERTPDLQRPVFSCLPGFSTWLPGGRFTPAPQAGGTHFSQACSSCLPLALARSPWGDLDPIFLHAPPHSVSKPCRFDLDRNPEPFTCHPYCPASSEPSTPLPHLSPPLSPPLQPHWPLGCSSNTWGHCSGGSFCLNVPDICMVLCLPSRTTHFIPQPLLPPRPLQLL